MQKLSHQKIKSNLSFLPPTRRRQAVFQVFITSAVEGSTAYFAVVIYAGRRRQYAFDNWIDNSTAERAWYEAYQLACEWRDANHPEARLVIRSIEEQEQRRSKAA